ncbi:MAG: A24 family peptidase [Pirellulales bacterium]
MTTSIAFATAVAACMTTAAVTDLHSRRIPNWLTVPMAACGLTFHALAPAGFGLGSSLLGLLVGFSLLLVPYVVGGGGAGDVKLLAAAGAWLGWKLLLVAFVMSILLARRHRGRHVGSQRRGPTIWLAWPQRGRGGTDLC